MECKECKHTFDDAYSFCPFCGNTSREYTANSINNSGNNSLNIGLGNNSRQNLYIKNFHSIGGSSTPVVEYADRASEKIVGGVKGYKIRYLVSGVISITAALITIADFVGKQTDFFNIFSILFLLLFGAYAFDSKVKYNTLQNEGIVYKKETPFLIREGDQVFQVKKYGICPICEGEVHIYFDSEFNKMVGKCNKNHDHRYTYDHTTESGSFIETYYNKYLRD